MSNKIEFENHHASRVIEIFFPQGLIIQNSQDIAELKNAWTKNLKSWHSPYTCIFDANNLDINQELIEDFLKLLKFFENFFMRKILIYSTKKENLNYLALPIFSTYEDAVAQTSLTKERKLNPDLVDFRSSIQIDNDFNAHVIEISFLKSTHFESKQDIEILKSKLSNILMQWHTPYNVLINCINISFSKETFEEFLKLEKFLKSFFCKKIIGYAAKEDKSLYPFLTLRSRHIAAGQLNHEGLQSGSMANCSSKKSL